MRILPRRKQNALNTRTNRSLWVVVDRENHTEHTNIVSGHYAALLICSTALCVVTRLNACQYPGQLTRLTRYAQTTETFKKTPYTAPYPALQFTRSPYISTRSILISSSRLHLCLRVWTLPLRYRRLCTSLYIIRHFPHKRR